MPACNFGLKTTKLLSLAVISAAVLLPCAAQTSTNTELTSPTITAPSMPTISSPTMGSGFYMPGNSNNPIYAPQANTSNNTSQSSETQENKNSDAKTQSLVSTLTASDVSTLDNLGLLSQLTSLTGSDLGLNTTAASTLSNVYSSTTDSQTNLLLQQVLAQLEELKAENKQLSAQIAGQTEAQKQMQNNEGSSTQAADTTAASLSAYTSTSSSDVTALTNDAAAARHAPHMLRFSVNGYNVLSTCRTLYISQIQPNGSFLVTGDRRYLSDGVTRTETFHILFKPNEASNGISSYSTATAVTQDWENVYSFLYQLAQKGDLNATRTGNLVSLRTSDPSWKLELLIDLDE